MTAAAIKFMGQASSDTHPSILILYRCILKETVSNLHPSRGGCRGEQRVVELFHNLRSNHETFIIFSEKATTLDLEFDPPLRTKSEARLRGDR